MARIAGIKIEKSTNGAPISICIDLRKFPYVWDLLVQKGIIESSECSPYNKKFVDMIKKSENEPGESLNLEKYGIKI